jgi:HK97 gp10 family phage protein
MPDNVRVVVGDRAIRALSSSNEMRDLLMDLAEPVVRGAQALAPKRSGRGAESIRAEPVRDGEAWTVRVSWTRDRYYMYFHDRGTVHMPAREFLERALERVTR